MATIGIVAAEGMSMMKRPHPAYGSGERQQHNTLGSVDVREGFLLSDHPKPANENSVRDIDFRRGL